ncbi:hypothetical protein, partial [Rugosimonospora acidiphila]|uniref:hypothetical protein n=1 Tax=Rugosimonospora acidiphila TaxID=556531 RepID=UPI0031E61966
MGAGLAFTGAGKAVISAVYNFLEFYSGVFSLVSLSIAVMVGLAATDRIVLMVRHRVLLQAVHRATASTAMVFLGIHIFTKIVEGHASVVDVVVPFLASHRVLYVGLGTLASYLMILVTWTGIIRGRFAGSAHPGLWRVVHASAYLSWVFALFHGLESGRHAKTWVTVSYVVCVLLVGLALLVRLSVTWGRRMRSPKAQTTGTIKAIGKPLAASKGSAPRALPRDEPLAPVGRTIEDELSFARRPLSDDPFERPTRAEDDAFARRALSDDAAPSGRPARAGRGSDLDQPLTLEGPGVEWYDEAGNHSFAAGPAFARGASRGNHSAPDDDDAPLTGQPLTGQPLPRLSYLDDPRARFDEPGGHRAEPEVRYQAPEEEPSFPASVYLVPDGDGDRSGTGSHRQVRNDPTDTGSYRQVRADREAERSETGTHRQVRAERSDTGTHRQLRADPTDTGSYRQVRADREAERSETGTHRQVRADREARERDGAERDGAVRDGAVRGHPDARYGEAGNQRGYSDGRRQDSIADGRRQDSIADGRRQDSIADGRRQDSIADGRRQ